MLGGFFVGASALFQAPPHVGDFTLAGGLATSPAWAPWLDSVNELLTTCTLLIGVALGLIRLVAFWRHRRARGQGESHN